MMGNAIGFPLCVGLGMVTGAVVAYVQESWCSRLLGVQGGLPKIVLVSSRSCFRDAVCRQAYACMPCRPQPL